ncbi:MAG TPA: hypothetical protein VHH36_00745 [Candidatus Thermoplasmatota archaeon]|nr:hypothetical protein [Candidatus Thermoplasmatota archaeon]
MRALAAALAAVLVAGCLQLDEPAAPAADAPDAAAYDAIEALVGAPFVEDHDHKDPAQHAASLNLRLVAQVTGEEGRVPPPGEGYMETAVKDGYAYLSRTGPEEGLVIFDVSDVEKPKFVSYLHLNAGFEPDVEVSDDGNWLFWETQRAHLVPPKGTVTAPATDLPNGVHIVDISDKANPRWAGWSATAPDGPHSITYAEIGGRHILFQNVYAWAYAYRDQEVPMMQRLIVSELDASGPVATLKTLAEYREPGATGKPGLFPHDVSVSVHPFLNKTIAYVAYWDVGVVMLDVTDPANPVKVGVATDFGPAPYRAVHMARPFPHLIDGRHVTVVEPEIGGEPDSGYMTFLDTTDPANPVYLSSWRLPGNVTSAGGALGPHYFDAADGRVALASYHAGFWIIDVHDAENLMKPRTVGFALVNATGAHGGTPSAFDAWWYEGRVFGGDARGGLSVFRYEGPAPAAEP